MRFPDGHGDGRHNENCARVVEAARDRVGRGLAQLALLIGRGAALLHGLGHLLARLSLRELRAARALQRDC